MQDACSVRVPDGKAAVDVGNLEVGGDGGVTLTMTTGVSASVTAGKAAAAAAVTSVVTGGESVALAADDAPTGASVVTLFDAERYVLHV
jgi:hypothetical protein